MSLNSMSGLVQNTMQNTSGLVDVTNKLDDTDKKATNVSNEVNILKRDIDGEKKNTTSELRDQQTQIDDLKKLFNEQYEATARNLFDLALKIGIQTEGLTDEQKQDIDKVYKKSVQSFKAMRATKTMMNRGVTSKSMRTGSMSVSNDLTLKGGNKSSIMNPDGKTKISSHGIMFGGANNKREINSAQISAGIHVPNSLNIVGMSDKKRKNRKIDMWAEGGLTIRGKTSINGDTNVNGKLIAANGVTITAKAQGDPMITRTFGNGDSYGLSYGKHGNVHVHAAKDHPPSAVHLGFKDKKNGYTNVLTAKKDKVEINGDTVVGNTLRVKADITGKKEHVMPRGWGGGVHTWDVYANATIGAGRNGKVNAYINSNGEVRGKNINAENKVCIGNTCINEKDVNSFKGTNSLKNGTNVNGKITTHSGVSVTKGNPGPLIEKRYNNNAANRYGISQENNGTVHLYAANAWEPSTLNLSYATGEGTYKPVLTAKKDKVEINGDTVVNGNIKGNTVNAGNKLCIGTLPNRVCIGASHLKNLMMGRTAHNHGNINHEWNKFKSSGQYKSFHASP